MQIRRSVRDLLIAIIGAILGIPIWGAVAYAFSGFWSSPRGRHIWYLLHTDPDGRHVSMAQAIWARTMPASGWGQILTIGLLCLVFFGIHGSARDHTERNCRWYLGEMWVAESWMNGHINHESGYETATDFRRMAYRVAGISDQELFKETGLDGLSISDLKEFREKLKAASKWMIQRITEHCDIQQESRPVWTAGFSQPEIDQALHNYRHESRWYPPPFL